MNYTQNEKIEQVTDSTIVVGVDIGSQDTLCLYLLHTLKDIKFTDIEEQGFMPVYERQEITDDLHETCGFRTDYQFITKRKMKGIQKKSKRR